MINKKEVGKRIRHLRNEKKWSQENLSEKANYARQTVGKWENGDLTLSLNDAINLCNLLDCDIGYLMGEYDTKKHVVADVCTVSGLSVKAVEKLVSSKSSQGLFPHDNAFIDTTNLLIEKFVDNMDISILEYQILINENKYLLNKNPQLSKNIKSYQYYENHIMQKEYLRYKENKEDKIPLVEHKLQKEFSKLLNLIETNSFTFFNTKDFGFYMDNYDDEKDVICNYNSFITNKAQEKTK